MTRGEQAIFNLEINKKRRSSNDIDIQHSKVFSSVKVCLYIKRCNTFILREENKNNPKTMF